MSWTSAWFASSLSLNKPHEWHFEFQVRRWDDQPTFFVLLSSTILGRTKKDQVVQVQDAL